MVHTCIIQRILEIYVLAYVIQHLVSCQIVSIDPPLLTDRHTETQLSSYMYVYDIYSGCDDTIRENHRTVYIPSIHH